MNKTNFFGRGNFGIFFVFAVAVVGAGAFFFGAAGVSRAQTQTLPQAVVPSGTIMITPNSLPDPIVNDPYFQTLTATGNIAPVEWSVSSGALPSGLMLDLANATDARVSIKGTPLAPGTFTFTIVANDRTSAFRQVYVLNVMNSAASTTPVANPPASSSSGPGTSSSVSVSSVTPTFIAGTSTLTPTSAFAIQQELNSLSLQIEQLQVAVANANATGGGSVLGASATGGSFDRDLTIGDTGPDVMALQVFLNSPRSGVGPITPTGPGSPGNETDYFGPLTMTALATWQTSQGISPAQGFFGPVTRARITSMMTAGTSVTPNASTQSTTQSTMPAGTMLPNNAPPPASMPAPATTPTTY